MDTYENNEMPQSSVSPLPAQQEPPKKESPFADSPYEMAQPVPEENPSEWRPEESEPVPEAPKPEKKKKRGVWKALLAAILAVAAVAAGCGITASYVRSSLAAQDKRNQQLMDQLNQQIADLKEEIKDNSFTGNGNSISGSENTGADDGMTPGQVYAKNVKSVVAISNQVTTNIYGQISETASSGSGFIISEDGYIVSNYHVVEGATKLTVILYNSTEYEAAVVGYDKANDLAVLKIDAQGLQAAVLGSSGDLIVGDQVVAIGNPLGELTSTLTVGFVSAKDRSINTEGTLINMIQTDAAINPGNSGGPLFNMKGEVIGITTAKYSGTTSSGASIEGIGFAIPMDDVIKKINDLVEYGYITGAQLGVLVHDMDQATAEYYNLPMGAYVKDVTRGSCAGKAGVKAKDIIVALGGYSVASLNDLSAALQQFKGGETTTITVWRGGVEMDLEITLDAKTPPASAAASGNSANGTGMPSDGSYEEWYEYFFGQK